MSGEYDLFMDYIIVPPVLSMLTIIYIFQEEIGAKLVVYCFFPVVLKPGCLGCGRLGCV